MQANVGKKPENQGNQRKPKKLKDELNEPNEETK